MVRARVVVRRGLESIGVTAVFVTAALGAVVLHADGQATRRLAVAIANDALANVFYGRLVIGEVTMISLGRTSHVRVAQAEILDPEGRRVILGKGIDARIDLARLVRSVARGGTPEVWIGEARVDDAEVVLDLDAKGDVGIARAFETRPSKAPKPSVPKPHSEDVHLWIPKAYVHHAWVHGNVVPPKLDADADAAQASLTVLADRFDLDVQSVRTTVRSPHGPGQAADLHGNVTGHLAVPLITDPNADDTFGGASMKWELTGDAAGLPLTAHFGIEGPRIDASVDIPTASAEVVKRAFPSLPLARPLELHAKAEGPLTSLFITARGRVGNSTLTGAGELGVREKQPFHFDADLVQVDGAAFAGPASDVSGHVHLDGTIAGGAPSGKFDASIKAAVIAGQQVPAISAEGLFDDRFVSASFRASEPGVIAAGKVVLHLREEKLDFDVNAQAKDLNAVGRAPGIVTGSARAHAVGALDLARSTVDAKVTASGNGIARAPISAASVNAQARVTGPLADPLIDVTADGTDVRLTASGKEPLTYPTANAHARIRLVPTPRILGAELRVKAPEGGASIVAVADEIRIDGGAVDVRGARVTGLGAPLDVEAHVAGGAISLRAKGEHVDVHRLAAMTGIRELKLLPEGSTASVDVDVKSTATRADGHVDVAISSKEGISGELHAKFEDRHVHARGRAALPGVGWVVLQRVELELPGGPSAAAFERATGSANVYGEIDLARGAAYFAGEYIEQISGTAIVSARIERGDSNNAPTLFATARTRGLDVTFNNEGKSTHIGGLDGSVTVAYDGATDDTTLAVLTWDDKGVIASAATAARVPFIDWARGTKKLDRSAITALEVAGVVDVPYRDVARLPGVFARPDLRGGASARAELSGTLAHPLVTLVARANDLGEKSGRDNTVTRFAPIDALLEARWDGEDVTAALRIDEDENALKTLTARASGSGGGGARAGARAKERKNGHVRGLVLARLSAADLLAGRPVAWNVSGELDAADMELAPLPLPMNIRGAVTGHVKLTDLAGTPSLEVKAHVADFGIMGARVASGDLELAAKDGSLDANARVEQADGGKGNVKVVSSSLTWRGADLGWDDAKPTRIEYSLDRVRLSILRPIVRQSIPEIDGVVEGRGSATIDAKSHVFEGGLKVSEGRLYVNALGEDLTDVSAVATFERSGGFRIQDATAKIGSGEVKASISGRMNGVRFESAEAVILIPSKDGVPLSAEGATYAQANGEVKLSAKMSADRRTLLVDVAVPRARVTLPDRGTQNLQSLEPDETIKIGMRKRDGTLAPAELRPRAGATGNLASSPNDATGSGAPAEAALATRFSIVLGDQVDLEGRGLKLVLGGHTVAEIDEEISMVGQITLRAGGTIDVQGRKFVVDRGTVTFIAGDNPADPIVIAAAYWDAPDRTRVWVEFKGPLKSGKLTLRSEPPYSKNEILSILLFGRADPNQARAGDARPSDAQAATALGSGIASSGLNKALGELDEDFDLEQDRTSANRVRTKVGYKLRRNLKVQLGYASGFSQREPDTTYLFLEWQFIPKWALIGTRGDRGTSILDVLFQHRY